MELNFNWINLLILFGAVHGLIFSIVLLFNRKHPGARFLSIFMFALAYNGFETFNWSGGLDRYIIFFDLFSFILIYALGPSLYLYVITLLYPSRKISRKQLVIHYALPVFQLLYRVTIAVLYFIWKIYGIKVEAAAVLMGVFWLYAEPLSVLVFLGYLAASIYQFRKAGTPPNIKLTSKEAQKAVRQWVKALLFCMVVLGIAWPLTVLAPHFFETDGSQYYPIELALVFFIYWIAFAGYHRTKTIYTQTSRAASAISTDEATQYMTQLQQTMQKDKLYLDPELTLDKVDMNTGMNAKTISAILNQHFQQSFNDFVNHYRVNEVKDKLLAGENQHLTISGIALECGFNSQATFQRAFKNSTGMSPREYLVQQLKKTG